MDTPQETAIRRHRPNRRRALDAIYPLALVVFALVGWHLWVTLTDVPAYQWPALGDVGRELIHSALLRKAALETVLLIATGFGLSVAVGLVLAALTVSSRFFEVTFFPLLVGKQFVPSIALAPLFIIWFGFGETPRLIILVLFGYFPILVTAVTGFRAAPEDMLRLLRAMGAKRPALLMKVRLPVALPNIFAGLKIAMTTCVIGAVIAEFIVGSRGLGHEILRAQGVGNSAVLVAGVAYLAVIGAAGYALVSLAERAAMPWRPTQESAGQLPAASV